MGAHVRERRVGLDRPLQHAKQRDAAGEGVGDGLEDERRRAASVDLDRGAALGRRGHALDEQVEQRVGAEVLRGYAAHHGEDLASRDGVLQRVRDLIDAELLALEVPLHQPLVRLHDGVEQLLAVLGHGVRELGRDLARRALFRPLGARVGLHVQEVDDARQLVLDSDRETHGDTARRELLLKLAERAVEVGALAVEHVHEDDAGEAARLRALPHAPGSHLHAHDGADHDQRTVGHRQAGDRIALEAGITGRVDEVDLPVLPLGVRERGRERHLPALLVLVPVGDGVARLDGSEPVRSARLEEHRLHERRLPGPAVTDDGDVADLPWIEGRHGLRIPPQARCAAQA